MRKVFGYVHFGRLCNGFGTNTVSPPPANARLPYGVFATLRATCCHSISAGNMIRPAARLIGEPLAR